MTNKENKPNNSGKKFLIYLVLFFMIFATVDAFFVYKAMVTHTGIVDQIHGK